MCIQQRPCEGGRHGGEGYQGFVKGIVSELKAKAMECEQPEELIALKGENGIELPEVRPTM